MAVSAIGLSRVQAPWQLYLCSIVMAVGWAATTTTAIATTLAYWFDRKARACAQPGAHRCQRRRLHHRTAAGAAGPPHGPGAGRAADRAGGPGDPAADGIRRRGARCIDRPSAASRGASLAAHGRLTAYHSQAQALRSLHFWSVALPFALALAAQVGFIVHQVAFLLPRLGSNGAGIAIGATAIAAAAGRLAFAPLIDWMNQRVAAAACFASQALGLGLMLAAAGSERSLVHRQRGVRAVRRQRDHAAGADRAARIRAAVIRPRGRSRLDGRPGDVGVRTDNAGPGAGRHGLLRRRARALHGAAIRWGGARACRASGEGVEAHRHGEHTRWTVGHRPEAARRTV